MPKNRAQAQAGSCKVVVSELQTHTISTKITFTCRDRRPPLCIREGLYKFKECANGGLYSGGGLLNA